LKSGDGFQLGRASEISRDELKFTKYIARLRKKFSGLFNDALKIQLIAKGIIREDEWDSIRSNLRYDFMKDNAFNELKEAELLQNRIAMLQSIEPFIGKFYSVDWVKKNVLRMSEEQIDTLNSQMKKEGDYQVSSAQQQGIMQGVQQVATQQELEKAGFGADQQQGDKK
jgi:hypothetical protein